MNQDNNQNVNNVQANNNSQYTQNASNVQNSVQQITETKITNTEPQVITPTQNVIVTSKKKTSNAFLFIAIIAVGVFIYFLDDILAYFNQSFSPIIENNVSDNGSGGLVDGYIKIDNATSYIKLKGIRFYNVKKSTNNSIFITYVSDKNYNSSNDLGITIEIYDSNKTKIYNENFNIYESIESNKARQYKIVLDENNYNNAYYMLIK